MNIMVTFDLVNRKKLKWQYVKSLKLHNSINRITLLKVMALIFNDASIASLSIMAWSSATDTFAERMTHMSHKLMFTALRSALLIGEPCKTEIFGNVEMVSHSLSM